MSPFRASAIAIMFLMSGAADPAPTTASKLEAIKKDVRDAEASYRKAAKEQPATPEGRKKVEQLWQEFTKKQSEGFKGAVELAKSNTKSVEAFAALEWVLTTPRAYYLPEGRTALQEMAEHHAANPKIGKVALMLGNFGPRESDTTGSALTVALFKAVLDKNPDRTARGQVALSLAWRAANRLAVAEHKKAANAEALAAEAVQAFEAVVKDYADCPLLSQGGTRTLGATAERELFALRNLRIGKVAPEAIGHDLEGKEVRLSSLRGKVVVLDIWATWCGPCRAMIPHEREMVGRLKDKPFVLVSISADDTKEALTKFLQKESMPWSHWWNGSRQGITEDWNVKYFPTIYVLDAKGVIRFKDIRGKELENGVDQLLNEIAGGKLTKS